MLQNGIITGSTENRMGLVDHPLITAIPLCNFITPILHIMLGKGNNILDNLIAEMQFVAELYTSSRKQFLQNCMLSLRFSNFLFGYCIHLSKYLCITCTLYTKSSSFTYNDWIFQIKQNAPVFLPSSVFVQFRIIQEIPKFLIVHNQAIFTAYFFDMQQKIPITS